MTQNHKPLSVDQWVLLARSSVVEITYDQSASDIISQNLLMDRENRKMWFGVTDLVNPTRKYYEVKFPGIPEDAEVIEKFRHGNNVHEMMFSWIRHFAPFAVREEEVNGEKYGLSEVRGRIDFRIGNHIIEFKTTSHDINCESDVINKNPQDLEQLVFYATLSGRLNEDHYLVYYEQDHHDRFRSFTIRISEGWDSLGFIRNRFESMVTSIRNSDSGDLGRCRYFEYGCKFRTNNICSCSKSSPIDSSSLFNNVTIRRNVELETKLEDGRINSSVTEYGSFSLWDLLIPRRVYLEKKGLFDPAEEAEPLYPDETLINVNNAVYDSGIYRERREMRIDGRSLGYFPMVSIATTPDGGVDQLERLYPVLVRSYSFEPDKLSTSRLSPFYILRLAMICSLAGSNMGYIMLGLKMDSNIAKCFRVKFRDLPVIRDKIMERIEEMEYSLSSDMTEDLPYCPSFVRDNCGSACLCKL
ncbi:hypothetical protein OXIME_000467 [Oxyplasma meridianum]|uniref:PD-(D/E)XK endonuclease-like domain-containing protein n=1 Tax=Oxyplasma meridianum TaxID=3073602 RepID=A0AAX4NEJ8_9ARCH